MTFDDIKACCDVDPDTGCWHWQGHTCSTNGAPIVYIKRKRMWVRRFVVNLKRGLPFDAPIKPGRFPHPKCRNPDCLCPEHMVTRTRGQYMKGSKRRPETRLKMLDARRARSPMDLDTARQLRVLANDGIPQIKLAKWTGLSKQMISKVINHHYWREPNPFMPIV